MDDLLQLQASFFPSARSEEKTKKKSGPGWQWRETMERYPG